MSKIKWSELKPEERDKLVAEKVMGTIPGECAGIAYYTNYVERDERYCRTCNKYYYDIGGDGKHDTPIPHYSTNIADAWLIFKEMHKAYREERVTFNQLVSFVQAVQARWDTYAGWLHPLPTAEDFCIDALRALGVEVEP